MEERYVLGEIAFVGFEDVNLTALRDTLRRRGVVAGIGFFQFPPSELKQEVRAALRDVYKSDEETFYRIIDEYWTLTYRASLTGAETVKITISKGTHPLCSDGASP